jgi:hypothetical protein
LLCSSLGCCCIPLVLFVILTQHAYLIHPAPAALAHLLASCSRTVVHYTTRHTARGCSGKLKRLREHERTYQQKHHHSRARHDSEPRSTAGDETDGSASSASEEATAQQISAAVADIVHGTPTMMMGHGGNLLSKNHPADSILPRQQEPILSRHDDVRVPGPGGMISPPPILAADPASVRKSSSWLLDTSSHQNHQLLANRSTDSTAAALLRTDTATSLLASLPNKIGFDIIGAIRAYDDPIRRLAEQRLLAESGMCNLGASLLLGTSRANRGGAFLDSSGAFFGAGTSLNPHHSFAGSLLAAPNQYFSQTATILEASRMNLLLAEVQQQSDASSRTTTRLSSVGLVFPTRQHAMLAHSHYTGQSSNDHARDENGPFQDGSSSDDKHGLN